MSLDNTRGRGWAPWILSAALSAGIFAYLLAQIDPSQILATARRLPARPLWIYGALVALGVFTRATRFWLLLGRRVGLGLLVGIVLARNLFVDLLPARVGELSYVYLLARRAERPAEQGLATLLLAMLFDIVALAPLLVLGVLLVGGRGELPMNLLLTSSVALAVAAYGAMQLAEPASRALARRFEGADRSPRRAHLARRLHTLGDALADTRARGIFLPLLGLSLVVRLCKFGSYYFLVVAVMTALGGSGPLEFFRILLGAVAAELAAALPVHGLAGFGTFEAAWALAFSQLGFTREQAIVTGILAHAMSQLLEYSVGAAALLWLMRPRPVGRRQ